MATFNGKVFNPEVFGTYVDTVPRVKQNAFLTSGVFRTRNDLKTRLVDQTGGNYITVPLVGRIGGTAQNYDGATNIGLSTLDTYSQSMVVVGRAHGWTEKDFTADITGHDFMGEVARQISDYVDDLDNLTIKQELAGIFGVNTDGFADRHTLDLTGTTTGKVTETSLIDATQKAFGANRSLARMVIMHSVIAASLEKMEVLEYRKYTDANGIQRQIELADWNGRTVLIDDDVPVTNTETTAGVYKVQITTKAAEGDSIKINNVTLVAGTDFSLSTDTATGNAAAIATALNASTDPTVTPYTWSGSSTYLVATEDSGHYGTGKFNAVATKTSGGTLVIGTVATDTPAVFTPVYTTYILGAGAIDYCDCGAKNPYEVDRNITTNGGEDILTFKQRKLFAPMGFSFVNPILSPTDAQLATAGNWDVVASTTAGKYFDSRAIPFARIISKG